MSRHLLTDTGFWIALYDKSDQYHVHAKSLAKHLGNQRVLIPWPCMYETLSTRLARRPDQVKFLKDLFQKLHIHHVDDQRYREIALKETVDGHSNYSLTDNVIRLMLNDPNLRVTTLLTFNPRDFYDVCIRKNIQLVQASDAQIHT